MNGSFTTLESDILTEESVGWKNNDGISKAYKKKLELPPKWFGFDSFSSAGYSSLNLVNLLSKVRKKCQMN